MEEREERIERSGSGRRESDKPSAWADPRTWMTLCGLLLAFLGYISNQLSTINGGIQALRDDAAHKTEQIAQLRSDVADLKGDNKTQVQINQQIRDRLAKLEGEQKKP